MQFGDASDLPTIGREVWTGCFVHTYSHIDKVISLLVQLLQKCYLPSPQHTHIAAGFAKGALPLICSFWTAQL